MREVTKSNIHQYLTSEPFALTDQSDFVYGVQYGITDTNAVVEYFTDGKTTSFKVQLVEEGSNLLLGEYDAVEYSPANFLQYKNIGYHVNTNGIGNRTVRLRLVIGAPDDMNYSLVSKYATESVIGLGKSFTQKREIGFKGSLVITDYALSQNYPNPFNPSTTIHYELPNAGKVTLKVYDALGREVKTLVNSYLDEGRYDVQFNVAHFASGVYFYRLTVQASDGKANFNQVKKMLLMK